MDPAATLRMLLDACCDNDSYDATEALRNLDEWITKGGFVPHVIREDTAEGVVYRVTDKMRIPNPHESE